MSEVQSIEPAPVRPALLALAIGLAANVAAWGYQVIGGYVPCKLCLQERIPYYVGLPVLAAAILLARPSPRLSRILAVLAGFIFLAGAVLGGYHAGAEWGFWPGPSDCGGGVGPTTSAADLMAQMRATRLVSCTEASWRMFGLSFAGWNVVASAAVALLAFRAAAGSAGKPL